MVSSSDKMTKVRSPPMGGGGRGWGGVCMWRRRPRKSAMTVFTLSSAHEGLLGFESGGEEDARERERERE